MQNEMDFHDHYHEIEYNHGFYKSSMKNFYS